MITRKQSLSRPSQRPPTDVSLPTGCACLHLSSAQGVISGGVVGSSPGLRRWILHFDVTKHNGGSIMKSGGRRVQSTHPILSLAPSLPRPVRIHKNDGQTERQTDSMGVWARCPMQEVGGWVARDWTAGSGLSRLLISQSPSSVSNHGPSCALWHCTAFAWTAELSLCAAVCILASFANDSRP